MDFVLRSPELLREVWVFQGGHYSDMLPFLHLEAIHRPILHYAIRTGTANLDLDPLHHLLTAWYAAYGVDRLPRLIRSMPHMKAIVLCDAAAFGNVAVLDSLNRLDPLHTYVKDEHVGLAAANGHIDVLRYLNDCPFGWTTKIMDYAATYGELDTVRWLHEHRAEGCSLDAMNHASNNGHLPVVEFLHLHRPEGCNSHAMDLAASNGHLQVVQWLHAHRTEGCTFKAMEWAASNGHLEVVQWLHAHQHGVHNTPKAMMLAAKFGHEHVVLYLYDHHDDEPMRRSAIAYSVMNEAAKAHHDEIVRAMWLQTNFQSSDLLRRAKAAGHVDFIKWLRQDTVREQANATNMTIIDISNVHVDQATAAP
ncbi:hypothetical protein DYB30_004791 [Aphanomyces astaci]|nr:hypothetical protein DYB36_005253 [Aphanomyces astaci]RHY53141.1 hypothetical protein DYB38_004926 [Aphanomyces astaci]RHY61264.1 hypothetical protein DYB30_004791 [Aphanomyces astaci]